jgi:hypothetical protein
MALGRLRAGHRRRGLLFFSGIVASIRPMFVTKRWARLIILCAAAVAAGCTSTSGTDGGSGGQGGGGTAGSGGTAGETPADPTVEGPIITRNEPFVAGTTGIDLADANFRQEEFFISGTATSYRNVGELGSDGRWTVEAAASAEFKTRALVYRPVNDADFSGTVVVEWLNVSGGLDSAPDWISMHTEMFRKGHVWVGVSAQIVGIEGRADGGAVVPLHLKSVDPERYGSLLHPGDSFSYDMFAQVGQAIRNPAGTDPLGGLEPQRVIAVGESQSAGRLITWINAFAPRYSIFDGYIVHSRGGGSAPLSQEPQDEVRTPDVVNVRDDLKEPTLMFQTETDLFGLRALPSNQPDSENFRLWEVAGTAHADVYTLLVGQSDLGDDPSVAAVVETTEAAPLGLIQCERFINSAGAHFVLKAGLNGLIEWIDVGTPLPEAPRLAVRDDQQGFEIDELGNVLGGIRTNYVDVPVAVLSGDGQTGGSFCRLFGTTEKFSDEQIAELYPTEDDYVGAVRASCERAVADGYLLQADADLIIVDAETSGIGGP